MSSYTVKKENSWQMFNTISAKYDLLNRLLSMGLDIRWRKRLAHLLPKGKNVHILDLATGTADVLISFVNSCARVEKGIGLDLAEGMLEVGRTKIRNLQLDNKLELIHGDAMKPPFDESSFDCVSMSFGIRNVPEHKQVLKEMVRVLKAGGDALILEFSLPKNSFIRFFHLSYLRYIVPIIGWIFSGNYKAYKYLNQTIEDFPYGKEFEQHMKEAGFSTVIRHSLLFGTATIYQGTVQK